MILRIDIINVCALLRSSWRLGTKLFVYVTCRKTIRSTQAHQPEGAARRTRWMERVNKSSLRPSLFKASYMVLQVEKDQFMKCSRCEGYLAIEQSIDFYHPEGRWRCVNCGALEIRHSYPSHKVLEKLPNATTEILRITRRPKP